MLLVATSPSLVAESKSARFQTATVMRAERCIGRLETRWLQAGWHCEPKSNVLPPTTHPLSLLRQLLQYRQLHSTICEPH
jgi:hypothetical protein